MSLVTACGGDDGGAAGAGGTSGGVGGTSGVGGSAGTAGATTTFRDERDGRDYRTVTIGGQRWFAENLAWTAPSGSFCYGDDEAQCARTGRLYTFGVAQDACPAGSHLASDEEWQTLERSLGMSDADLGLDGYSMNRGDDQGAQLRVGGSSGFELPVSGYATVDASGETATGFDGLSSGVPRSYLWTSTTRGSQVIRRRVEQQRPYVYRFANPAAGFAIVVRCLVD